MSWKRTLASGFLGAVAVTAVNEAARRATPDAPRLDLLGMRGLARLLKKTRGEELPEQEPTPPEHLRWPALAGDLVMNTAYFSLAGPGKAVWGRGVGLGLAAGIGSVLLPPKMGMNDEDTKRSRKTALMSVGWYLLGGLAAAGAGRLMERRA